VTARSLLHCCRTIQLIQPLAARQPSSLFTHNQIEYHAQRSNFARGELYENIKCYLVGPTASAYLPDVPQQSFGYSRDILTVRSSVRVSECRESNQRNQNGVAVANVQAQAESQTSQSDCSRASRQRRLRTSLPRLILRPWSTICSSMAQGSLRLWQTQTGPERFQRYRPRAHPRSVYRFAAPGCSGSTRTHLR
jgi:hypothetical protein